MWPLTLTHVTFAPDPSDPWPWTLPVRRSNETWNHILTWWPLTLTFMVDLWPWLMCSLVLTQVTLDLTDNLWANQMRPEKVFLPGDLDLWPMTPTLKVDLGGIHVHALTKFHDPTFKGFWTQNNFFLVWILVKSQTYRKQCIWAHLCVYRWAQKLLLLLLFFFFFGGGLLDILRWSDRQNVCPDRQFSLCLLLDCKTQELVHLKTGVFLFSIDNSGKCLRQNINQASQIQHARYFGITEKMLSKKSLTSIA